MIKIPFSDLKSEFKRSLLKLSFEEKKADLCAEIFAANSLDGVYSHGVNRFPVFVKYVKQGLIDLRAEPELLERNTSTEHWDGHLGPGMYNAALAMGRAIDLAKENGLGCVALRNTNHWMRGGTYGWQAAAAGCIGICFTNTIANMPPWGGTEPRIGNNPLVIAVPRSKGHVVLDTAMSQYSYGKLQEHTLKNKPLAVPGGYDREGLPTSDPREIMESQRPLPIGYWKGSGLSVLLDVLLTAIMGGRSVAKITADGAEYGLSQFFLCLHRDHYHETLIEEILEYTRSSALANPAEPIRYPGESTLEIRRKNEMEGIPVHEQVWAEITGF
jgi:3-dehydro-L-gulonate 2-dehydrogenase